MSTMIQDTLPSRAVDSWEAAAAYFDSICSELGRDPKYRGRFVAVTADKILDVDSDEFRLARRMLERYPGEATFIEKIQQCQDVFDLPSPELAE
jgi:hypothetical protein